MIVAITPAGTELGASETYTTLAVMIDDDLGETVADRGATNPDRMTPMELSSGRCGAVLSVQRIVVAAMLTSAKARMLALRVIGPKP
jgi:hypothetical protein